MIDKNPPILYYLYESLPKLTSKKTIVKLDVVLYLFIFYLLITFELVIKPECEITT